LRGGLAPTKSLVTKTPSLKKHVEERGKESLRKRGRYQRKGNQRHEGGKEDLRENWAKSKTPWEGTKGKQLGGGYNLIQGEGKIKKGGVKEKGKKKDN